LLICASALNLPPAARADLLRTDARDRGHPRHDEAGECSRTERFRRTVRVIAQTLDLDADVCSAQLVAGLAMLAQAIDKDLAEADWWRLLDALLLIATYPAVS
jgi:hypothetical protein